MWLNSVTNRSTESGYSVAIWEFRLFGRHFSCLYKVHWNEIQTSVELFKILYIHQECEIFWDTGISSPKEIKKVDQVFKHLLRCVRSTASAWLMGHLMVGTLRVWFYRLARSFLIQIFSDSCQVEGTYLTIGYTRLVILHSWRNQDWSGYSNTRISMTELLWKVLSCFSAFLLSRQFFFSCNIAIAVNTFKTFLDSLLLGSLGVSIDYVLG